MSQPAFSCSISFMASKAKQSFVSSRTCKRKESSPSLHFSPKSMSASPPPPVEIPPEFRSLQVLGLGMAGIDILARVHAFPEPEQKIRTKGVSVLGGGNTANALTALRRLGIPAAILSKVGNDMYGAAALQELQQDGIDTKYVVCKDGVTTQFTYVIVDETKNTRTCISTPGSEDLLIDELSEDMLDGVSLLALDGRHTAAAIEMAKHASRRGIPILLDVERERPFIRELMPYADYIITNKSFPFAFSPNAPDRVDALERLLQECNARFVISTLGSFGSVLIRRSGERNAGSGLDMVVQSKLHTSYNTGELFELLECPAWPPDKIVDTTGAGDAFIGGIMYGILTGMEYERMLSLASRVASAKLAGLGSRSTLPRRESLPEMLLAVLPTL